jgi:FkbM family methyltransferase
MNTVLNLLKSAVPRGVKQRVKRDLMNYFQVPTSEWSLENMRRLGFRPSSAVDIGAYKGEWTVATKHIFPEASFLMLEAQQARQPDLEAVKQSHGPGIDYRIALLGPENRDDVVFNEYPKETTGCSMLSDWRGSFTNKVHCRMRTLDTVLAEAGVAKVDLIKLDVQGYELEVLQGAPKVLSEVQAILMEVSLIDLYQKNPLLHDVVAFMQRHQFVAYDISALMRRPLDQAMAQLDVIFVPQHSPLRQRKEYGLGNSI